MGGRKRMGGRNRRGHRAVMLILTGSLALTGVSMSMARATSSLDAAMSARGFLGRELITLHHRLHVRRLQFEAQIKIVKSQSHQKARLSRGDTVFTYRSLRRNYFRRLRSLKRREREVLAALRARRTRIRARKEQLSAWIDSYGIFSYCPVAGNPQVMDNFGVVVDLPGVPEHIHQGDDISAPTGTPIVAPFDGDAVATSSDLGGMSVDVYGAAGHVYNAHLSSYGRLGSVTAGTIVGYVGSTGDATGPHDHFEWHPGNGTAVDPYPYLAAVC
jgi:murein DD-endopeptidase MepM/ murein hydrolase activator NlpD